MMNRRHFIITAATALGATLSLSACAASEPIASPVAQVGFAHLPVLTFNVARVDVVSHYKSPMHAPNAEHRMPAPPERALFDWALARLKSSGGASSMVATFVIEDAAVIETKVEKTPGFKALFTHEVTERYDARAVASLTIKGPAGQGSGSVRVSSTRSIEVREDATLAEREQAWVELVEAMMADFNAQMEIEIATYLAAWLQR